MVRYQVGHCRSFRRQVLVRGAGRSRGPLGENNMTISASRQRELLNAQSAIAKKVFEVVPMQEAWTSQSIAGALQQQTRSSIQFRTLQGCLNTLKEAGLISEPRTGFFQQVAPREVLKQMTTKPEYDAPRKSSGAVELLRELADHARVFALDIEAVADVIAEERNSNAEATNKLAQLQAILKSLA